MLKRLWCSMACAAVACGSIAVAQSPLPPFSATPSPMRVVQQGRPATPQTPQTPVAPFAPGQFPTAPMDAGADALSQAAMSPEAGAGAAPSAAPNMLGDFLGIYSKVPVTRTVSIPITIPASVSGGVFTPTRVVFSTSRISGTANVPNPGRGGSAFKIAHNESPRPQDRIFINYNYYNDIGFSDLHREVFGFERTFLDGNASFGLRVPIFQVTSSDGGFGQDDLGDITAILKYAFINDCHTGNVLSGGLAVTAPTGPGIPLGDGTTLDDVLLQPFLGYIVGGDNLFFHGFTSLVVPTDSRDVTLLFNDFGVGYWLRRCSCDESLLTGIVPTAEIHINTPLNNRGSQNSPIGAPDLIVPTVATTFLFRDRATLAIGGAIPVTGPNPYDFQGIVQFNLRF